MTSRTPRLVIVLAYEADVGKILLDSASYEDELRLRVWLRRSRVFRDLPELLERLLDDLDEAAP